MKCKRGKALDLKNEKEGLSRTKKLKCMVETKIKINGRVLMGESE